MRLSLIVQKSVRLEHHSAAVQQCVANKESLGPDATEQMDAYRRSLLKREHNLTQKDGIDKQETNHTGDAKASRLERFRRCRGYPKSFPKSQTLMLALQRLQLKLVQDRTVASVFVLLNPSEPGDCVNPNTAMLCGFICTLDLLSCGVLQVSPSKPRAHYDCHDIFLCLTVAMPIVTGLLT